MLCSAESINYLAYGEVRGQVAAERHRSKLGYSIKAQKLRPV